MLKRYVIGSATALCALISATTAKAETPFTADKIQVGGGLNYGIFMGDDEGDPPNPYNLGLGLDLGYTLGPGVYLGGEFNYFFGSSEETLGIEVSSNIMQYGVVVGYDLGLTPELVLRPQVGIGMGSATVEVSGGGFDDSQSESGLFIPIGAGILYSMGSWYLGGDLRYSLFSITSEVSDGMGGTVEEDFNSNGLLLGVFAGGAF
jgi:hypothetical protein